LKRPDATVVPYGYMEHMQSLKETDGRAMRAMGGEWLAPACVEAGLLGTTETVVMPIILGMGSGCLCHQTYNLKSLKSWVPETGIVMAEYSVLYGGRRYGTLIGTTYDFQQLKEIVVHQNI
jgi:hypothetical protein